MLCTCLIVCLQVSEWVSEWRAGVKEGLCECVLLVARIHGYTCFCVLVLSLFVCLFVCMYVDLSQVVRKRFSCLQDLPLKGKEFEYIRRP